MYGRWSTLKTLTTDDWSTLSATIVSHPATHGHRPWALMMILLLIFVASNYIFVTVIIYYHYMMIAKITIIMCIPDNILILEISNYQDSNILIMDDS